MADTRTEHLNLIKQDPEAVPDYLDDHSNLEILDEEVWKRGKAFNGQPVGEDGGFHIRNVPYAENLETSSSQSSDADFIIRTTGGDASLMDGDAWLTLIKGTMTHTGYVPQSITMTVTPMARPTPPAITATLNNETFIAYVQQPGEYTISYTTSWSESPATYGITVSNDPVNGDSITVVWDGEDDPEMTVNAVPRQAPESIAAVIDDSVFVAYVQQSGTTTLTYGTSWSADPSLYGITVTGTPIAGDVITVVYVKEVRGTIIQSTPETFVSTGWNLYNHTAGYARVIKYSTEYNFKISGAYTALEFASTPSGTRTTITPVSGAFSIPADGYIIVTGGNATTTAIWMTWSDWGSGYNWDGTQQGDFAPYSESIIDFGTFMATNFPYGLMQVGTAQDEINFNIGIATSKVLRLAYNDTNLATAKASGRQYEYDENYIYLERETTVTYSIEVDGDYTAFDHGMEYFTGTAQAVYAQTLYGQNLKNKLERDVLTISQQTLTAAQKAQVQNNVGLVPTESTSINTSGYVADARVIKTLNGKIAPIIEGNTISANADLDSYTTPGMYYASTATAATLSNCPVENAFWLEVWQAKSGTIMQRLTRAANGYNDTQYTRQNGYTWKETGIRTLTAKITAIQATSTGATFESALHDALYAVHSAIGLQNLVVGDERRFALTWTSHDYYYGEVVKTSSDYVKGTCSNGVNYYEYLLNITNDTLTVYELALNDKINTKDVTGITISSTDERYKSESTSYICKRTGNVVQLNIATRWDFSVANFNVGDEVTLSINGAPNPVSNILCVIYHSARIMIGTFSGNDITVRNMTTVNTNNNAPLVATFVYVCE